MAQKVQKVPDAKPDDLNLLPETPWWNKRAGPTSCPLNLHTHAVVYPYCCPVDIR